MFSSLLLCSQSYSFHPETYVSLFDSSVRLFLCQNKAIVFSPKNKCKKDTLFGFFDDWMFFEFLQFDFVWMKSFLGAEISSHISNPKRSFGRSNRLKDVRSKSNVECFDTVRNRNSHHLAQRSGSSVLSQALCPLAHIMGKNCEHQEYCSIQIISPSSLRKALSSSQLSKNERRAVT